MDGLDTREYKHNNRTLGKQEVLEFEKIHTEGDFEKQQK
jgi:hypothetical protein